MKISSDVCVYKNVCPMVSCGKCKHKFDTVINDELYTKFARISERKRLNDQPDEGMKADIQKNK